MKSYIALFAFLLLVGLVGACEDNNAPTNPNYPPNIFTDISGAYQVDYRGLASIYTVTSPHNGLTISSSFKDSTGISHYLIINAYFLDNVEKTGTFKFITKPDTATSDYAVCVYQHAEGTSKRLFTAYNGEVVIQQITGATAKGTFNLFAKEASSGSNVIISNGTFDIGE